MSAYYGVKKCLGEDLTLLAKQLGYSQSNVLILEGKESELKHRFPLVYRNILTCGHHKDGRTYFEYAQDLVASWLMEDMIKDALNKSGFEVRLAGADKKREILTNTKTSAASDFYIYYKNRAFLVELMCDYGDYWERTGILDLRDQKYLSLIKENSILLAISPLSKKYRIIDCKTAIVDHYGYHRLWRKNAYSLKLSNNARAFTYEGIVQSINQYMDRHGI